MLYAVVCCLLEKTVHGKALEREGKEVICTYGHWALGIAEDGMADGHAHALRSAPPNMKAACCGVCGQAMLRLVEGVPLLQVQNCPG